MPKLPSENLTITCHGRVFRINRLTAITQSPYLKIAFEKDLWEIEATTNNVSQTIFDAYAVARFVDYLNRHDYNIVVDIPDITGNSGGQSTQARADDQSSNTSNRSSREWTAVDELIVHVQAYAIAGYYQVDGMAILAREKFDKGLQRAWPLTNVIRLLEEIYHVSKHINAPLRQLVLSKSISDIHRLYQDDEFMGALSDSNHLTEYTTALFKHTMQVYKIERSITTGIRVELADLHTLYDDQGTALTHAQDDIEGIQLLSLRNPECLNCGRAMAASVERSRSTADGKLMLRCRYCRATWEQG